MSEPDFDDPSGRLPLLNEPAISASPSLTQTPTRRGAIAILAVVMVATAFASLLSGSTPRLMFYGATASQRGTHQLALISIDGFRFDYIDRRWRAASVNESQYGNEGRARKHGAFIAPNLRHLAGKGCFSSMQPVFPSKTFPNHNSIATGLFPAYSGIVGNTMVRLYLASVVVVAPVVARVKSFVFGTSETEEPRAYNICDSFYSVILHHAVQSRNWQMVPRIHELSGVVERRARTLATHPHFVLCGSTCVQRI